MDARRSLLPVIALTLVAAACSSGGGATDASSPPASGSSSFAAEVATSDLSVGAPQRVEVGVFSSTSDGGVQLLSFGTVQLAFTFVGSGASATPGPTATATYLPAPGTQGDGTGPALTSPSAARGVYQAEGVSFDRAGNWQVEVTADVQGAGTQHLTAAFPVLEQPLLPAPGQKALKTENLTVTSKGVPAAAIDSRALDGAPIPDPELHRWTIARALAEHRPIVVVFATPTYCMSQFCGPTTDAVQALAGSYGDKAVFIHVEIWKDYQNSVVNQGAAEWLYPPALQKANGDLTEPWIYLIGADGVIVDRWGPLFDPGELARDLQALPRMHG